MRRTAAIMAIAGTACADAGAVPCSPTDVALEPIASAGPVPYSPSDAFTTVDTARACVFDAYEVQIVCGDRSWTELSVFGREGAGPGELGRSGELLAGPAGSLVFFDRTNSRASRLTSALEFTGSSPLPSLASPAGDVSPGGGVTVFTFPGFGAVTRQRLLKLDPATGKPVDDVPFEFDAARVGADTAIFNGGVVAPDGRVLMRFTAGGESHLAWYGSDGAFLGLLNLPRVTSLRPQARQRERDAETFRNLLGPQRAERFLAGVGEVEAHFLPRGAGARMLQVDGAGRAWGLSNRPSERGSFLELFDGVDHIGNIEVEGWVLAFHIREPVLAALVEDVEPDALGLYPRRIRWYRIVAPAGSRPADERCPRP